LAFAFLEIRMIRLPTSFIERERAFLAPYAVHSAQSAGRRFSEPPHPYRGPFQRDRDRVVHSAAYRRLSAKTQVFTGELGDYHRTRLTHTHEVASVARTIGRALALNEDLIEALALVHDLGHPPFGHSGEEVLNECLKPVGGFCHNAQALRIVELLETRYPDFPGLNLSLEVLAGQKHRVDRQAHPAVAAESAFPDDWACLEVQVVDAADSVAYDTHDADDALELELLTLEELLQTHLWAEAARRVRRRYSSLQDGELRRAVLHELIDWQVNDLISTSIDCINCAWPGLENSSDTTGRLEISFSDRFRSGVTMINPSQELAEQKMQLEAFLFDRVYRHPDVLVHRTEAQGFLRETFFTLLSRPDLMPQRFRQRVDREGLERSVGDYLAGMTDRFARREYDRVKAIAKR
jgi:dGTPase